MTPNEKRPQQDCGGMFTQVQASVEILSPVPVSGKGSEKDYERLFIRDPEVQAREGKKNETISMTDILLAVSVGCNLWFLFLLLYERVMDTRIVRFFKGIVGLWRSLDGNEAKRIASHEEVPAEKADIIGKSRFRMASTRTTAAIPAQEAATSETGIELSEEEATFDDGNTETASRPAQVPEAKINESVSSIPQAALE